MHCYISALFSNTSEQGGEETKQGYRLYIIELAICAFMTTAQDEPTLEREGISRPLKSKGKLPCSKVGPKQLPSDGVQ